MSSRAKTVYVCQACGGESTKWQGQCPHCTEWNQLIEMKLSAATPKAGSASVRRFAAGSGVTLLSTVSAEHQPRQPTGMAELDRVLGGGIVPGAVILLGGGPGIGKSTLLLQAISRLSMALPVLYVTGEESVSQVALRARRLELPSLEMPILAEIELQQILNTLTQQKPQVVVIDSIQTLHSDALTAAPGSVSQVRECAATLTHFAKTQQTTVILVGHVTKDGALAGPRVLEHMVDTVLYFEGDTHSSFRVVRAFKNRFGAVNEIGVFGMTERGLKEVSNPSALFLSQHSKEVAGSCVMVTQEGTRPLLVEIQALVDTALSGHPKRLSVGLESNRLALLLAVLHRHMGIFAADQDVFVNAVGGVKIDEPGADLPVLLAILSSLRNRPLPAKMVAFGEVGLAGEVRPVQRGLERLREAAKLGFTHALIPKANAPKSKAQAVEGIAVTAVDRVEEALQHVGMG